MQLEKNYDGKELTIIVKDSVDTVTAPDFENAIIDEFDKFDSLIVDFKELEYISSAGLRVLVTVQKKLKPQNIPFVIYVNDNIREIFLMAGFDKILTLK